MKIILTTLKKTLFWSYERGSWQYDVMCVLILAFIFLVPSSLFHNPITVRGEEIGEVEPARVEQQIADHLAHRYGHPIAILRWEKQVEEQSGEVTYLIWER
jgi:hypothetical protein